MKCISIVNTQLQLLNSIEFVSEHNITDHTLLVYAVSEKRLEQINNVLNFPFVASKINKLYYILAYGRGNGYLRTVYNRVKVKCIFKKKKYDYCLICNYHVIAHRNLLRLASSNNETQLVHLDDGLAIADCVELRTKELQTGKPSLVCSISDKFLYNYQINKYIPKSILFFTPYRIKVAEADRYEINEYTFLKNQILSYNSFNLSKASVIFLGQPIVKDGLLTRKQYSSCIEGVLRHFAIKEGSYIYLPHPVENIDLSLDETVLSRFSIFKTGLPFELLCNTINENAFVFGFYTAALSCIKTFDVKCEVYAMHPQFNYKDKEEMHVIETAYQYLEKIGIKEITL